MAHIRLRHFVDPGDLNLEGEGLPLVDILRTHQPANGHVLPRAALLSVHQLGNGDASEEKEKKERAERFSTFSGGGLHG